MSERNERPAENTQPGEAPHKPEPATPRWVKGFIVVGVLLVVAFVVLHLAGGGMGSHTP
ncbi:hypothetical protein [Arthrobacter sp. ISL-65]|uniref:hypothetical protein n=1 Tax=Arthrobacter sp. ISL-65 TaxID=2819112 RepID=UPI001BE95C70|nr:hypothetical protein [Arthrobacter sp. ISL-65]MBT2548988.1 hypothetical protein [Arthrobacter sp. ISL-65]